MNILTSFPFTFKLAVPGLSNPFTSLSTSPTTGRNPINLPPPSSTTPSDVDVPQEQEQERLSRARDRPTRPLPMSIGSNPILGTSLRRPRPSFSPSPSPTPSTSVSFTHSYGAHLAPPLSQQTRLSPYEQWQQQQQLQDKLPLSHSYLSAPAPLSRKRGWEPSNSSPSGSQTTLASTSGYLDTPAKYRDMAERMEVVDVDELRELDSDDLPPTKRRRGIAGSIVSTAWSAALIGTAVGLSVYRLWRDRGRQDSENDCTIHEDESCRSRKRRATNHSRDDDDDRMVMSMESPPPSPPPPYNHEWTAVDYPRTVLLTPSRRAGKIKAPTTPRAAAARRMGAARRSHQPLPKPAQPASRPGSSRQPPTNAAFDFNFGASTAGRPAHGYHGRTSIEEPEVDVEDQMDWIGGKLAQLIEEGKKALKTEVVVMSETKEDEVDDGSGAWVSDEEEDERAKTRRRGSTASTRRYVKRGTPQPSGSHSHTPAASPARVHQGPGLSTYDGFGDSCESPEVREMMERARAKFGARPSGR